MLEEPGGYTLPFKVGIPNLGLPNALIRVRDRQALEDPPVASSISGWNNSILEQKRDLADELASSTASIDPESYPEIRIVQRSNSLPESSGLAAEKARLLECQPTQTGLTRTRTLTLTLTLTPTLLVP